MSLQHILVSLDKGKIAAMKTRNCWQLLALLYVLAIHVLLCCDYQGDTD